MLLSGAAGNWLTAALRGAPHSAVGASTGIFGGIGGLAALELMRRRRGAAVSAWRAWAPIAAGLALLGFLGTSPQSDVLAHLFGFAVGALLGVSAFELQALRDRRGLQLRAVRRRRALTVVACWCDRARVNSPWRAGLTGARRVGQRRSMVKLIFLCRRRPDITHERYVELLLKGHVPIALRHHPTHAALHRQHRRAGAAERGRARQRRRALVRQPDRLSRSALRLSGRRAHRAARRRRLHGRRAGLRHHRAHPEGDRRAAARTARARREDVLPAAPASRSHPRAVRRSTG